MGHFDTFFLEGLNSSLAGPTLEPTKETGNMYHVLPIPPRNVSQIRRHISSPVAQPKSTAIEEVKHVWELLEKG